MRALNQKLIDRIEEILGTKLSSVIPVPGGDINHAYKLTAGTESYFMKTNSASHYPGMFRKEASGLAMLREVNALHIPQVIAEGEADEWAFLLFEFIHSGSRNPHYWRDMGNGLATIHRVSSATFGLDEDNYIGTLPQSNRQHQLWSDFFVQERLNPLIKRAFDHHFIGKKLELRFDNFISHIADFFPPEPPALLHGDLWTGNQIPDASGNPCLIDPAVYFGHREADIAMSRLFGHFSIEFYHAYEDAFPMQHGWEERMDFYNLYPLLVHLNLFGTSYLPLIEDILE